MLFRDALAAVTDSNPGRMDMCGTYCRRESRKMAKCAPSTSSSQCVCPTRARRTSLVRLHKLAVRVATSKLPLPLGPVRVSDNEVLLCRDTLACVEELFKSFVVCLIDLCQEGNAVPIHLRYLFPTVNRDRLVVPELIDQTKLVGPTIPGEHPDRDLERRHSLPR